MNKSIVRKIIYISLIIIIALIYARFCGTKGFNIKKYNVSFSSLPESFDGFTIAHFSDIDLNSTFFIDSFSDVVKEINKLNPDIVVFTGDMFYNVDKRNKDKLVNELNKIDPLIDKYLVRGDKDVKNKYYKEIVSSSGFTDLTNKGTLIYYKGLTPIGISGIDSLNKGKQNYTSSLSGASTSFKILLAHEPDSVVDAKDLDIKLMLSGHSHSNEINIPLVRNLFSLPGAKKYNNDYYKVNNTKLFISSGLGTEKTFMRLNLLILQFLMTQDCI